MSNLIKELFSVVNAEDYRDFFEKVNNWSYSQDFTYRDHVLRNGKLFLKALVISQFVDSPFPITGIREAKSYLRANGESLAKTDEKLIRKELERIGLV